MLTIPNARADSDLVRERIHRRQGEGDSLSIDLSLNNRIGIDAGGRVLYIHEPGGQRLHHLPINLRPEGTPTLLIVTVSSSSGDTGPAGNDMLRSPG